MVSESLGFLITVVYGRIALSLLCWVSGKDVDFHLGVCSEFSLEFKWRFIHLVDCSASALAEWHHMTPPVFACSEFVSLPSSVFSESVWTERGDGDESRQQLFSTSAPPASLSLLGNFEVHNIRAPTHTHTHTHTHTQTTSTHTYAQTPAHSHIFAQSWKWCLILTVPKFKESPRVWSSDDKSWFIVTWLGLCCVCRSVC